MVEAWAPIEFDVVAYRTTGTSVVKVSDECNTLLDDHIVLTQQFSFSPHKGPFETRITDWETKLRLVQEVLSEWLACQRNWMYLQPIFDSEDIQRQLPAEAKRFSAVDKLWRKTIKAVTAAPHVLTFCDDDALLTAWSSANEELERVQKNLADYLETKRAAFARFYFLSNDELISILSQTKDPNAVQPHLRKCFEAIHSITMTGEQCEMSDMISAEKEVMPFDTPLQPKGSVELWMGEIETTMRRSVRKETETGIADYKVQARGDFMKSHASMVAISVSQLDWTSCVELAISDGGCDGVRQYLETMVAQLKELSLLVRTKLSKLQSKVMSAIIVMELHARDVVERLIEAGVSRTGDFEWVSQLRYYWEERESRFGPINMLVRMVQSKQCVVFNCSDGLDYKAMGKFFKGLSTAGAWACFDEFNRIDIEVLSVIAQQMLNIQSAIIQEKEIFEFEGSQIRLDPTTATFITMNPGYAGRTELPDNLKALFRPMAMMAPTL
ncbi:hypothetical protein EMIHUDRAFT_248575 [Emiliania huxleyi CCMP1516]|uniref:Dynein heavy chain n=2 Tax=Emiliania huxleyi TaxID=2903 RepID=A0A0D3IF91_EMIH1|nr:hypothetical protein EMIHUDRAFT_248575 [Emiliania huxleyi CCMP1516]EOD09926.1 hypothetical protein EMIHUDRAFT_248575 [Emiliania huxleyi CCMP1516]|eukprot:XP_005762355.1 hypothetical protein EMIHUDRAFT_248575 [Emiliania huxleyi CCMP1516]